MARIETDPNYTAPTFPRATAATDLFKKEDVQQLAAAMSTHVHDGTGKGLAIPFATAIPNGTITSAMIADGTIVAGDIADGAVTSTKLAAHAITQHALANGVSSGPTTTAAPYVDMPDMVATLTTRGGELLCFLFASVNNDIVGQGIQIGISVDSGVPQGPQYVQAVDPAASMSMSTVFTFVGLPAGSHTVKGAWGVSGGTGRCTSTFRHLLVLELTR